ncbi:MAG: hypothetical protein QOG54_1593 [Actinomycetota bacterium]|jgi:hypothetical protein|nr:hypothetical protein [Actinomycetota bacterium]
MTADVATGTPTQANDWTPARIFMVASAIFHLPVAIAGLAVDQTFPFGAAAAVRAGSGEILGVLETNGWHSLAALFLGLVSAYFALRPERAREGALAIGISHVGIVLAFALWEPSTFGFMSNGADQVVHATTAITGIASGLLTRPIPSRAAAPGG